MGEEEISLFPITLENSISSAIAGGSCSTAPISSTPGSRAPCQGSPSLCPQVWWGLAAWLGENKVYNFEITASVKAGSAPHSIMQHEPRAETSASPK